MKRLFAATKQIERARDLRNEDTEVEKKLWHRLRDRRLLGYKFRRQHPIGKYILDFACEEHKLGIELDGSQHAEVTHARYDAIRSVHLGRSGWRVLRFWNNEVNENIEAVLEVILDALTQNQQG